jgi:hypothetical protein
VLAAVEKSVASVTVCQPLAPIPVKVALAICVPVAVDKSSRSEPGVAGAAVELEGGDLNVNRGRGLHTNLNRCTGIPTGLRRKPGSLVARTSLLCVAGPEAAHV